MLNHPVMIVLHTTRKTKTSLPASCCCTALLDVSPSHPPCSLTNLVKVISCNNDSVTTTKCKIVPQVDTLKNVESIYWYQKIKILSFLLYSVLGRQVHKLNSIYELKQLLASSSRQELLLWCMLHRVGYFIVAACKDAIFQQSM